MNISVSKISTGFKGDYCFTHARAAFRPDGFGILTTQPLRLSGSDIFYGMYIATTRDFGKTWTELVPSKTVVRFADGEYTVAMCDATPLWHEKTGKFLLTGHGAYYVGDEAAPSPHPRRTLYTVYDEAAGDFGSVRALAMPEDEKRTYFNCGNGSGQCQILDGGDLLLPVYHMSYEEAKDPWHSCCSASVAECGFDGETLSLKRVGPSLSVSVPRGLCEGSVIAYGGAYYQCLRNDVDGFVAKSADGITYDAPKPLVFDDGESVGNYCTQQHWIAGGGRLYLVYTRRGADNDHVFRHRAPLFIAEFDTERMCLLRETETVAVPNRGARLGNFCCTALPDGSSMVVASEWMQTTPPDCFNWRRCMEYGADNSIFFSHVSFD